MSLNLISAIFPANCHLHPILCARIWIWLRAAALSLWSNQSFCVCVIKNRIELPSNFEVPKLIGVFQWILLKRWTFKRNFIKLYSCIAPTHKRANCTRFCAHIFWNFVLSLKFIRKHDSNPRNEMNRLLCGGLFAIHLLLLLTKCIRRKML